jgi:hypothetical protein
MGAWTGLIWLRIGTGDGLLWRQSKNCDSGSAIDSYNGLC